MLIQSEVKQPERKVLTGLFFFCLFGFIVFIRMRLLDIPLERDEGEYAYMAQLLLKGFAPFSNAYNMKYPGVSFFLAPFIALLGNSTTSIHIALLCANLVSVGFIYLITKRLMGQIEGIIAASLFGLLSLSQYYLGFAAHATHFVLLFALPGFFYLIKGQESKSTKILFLSGFLLGISFLMKQSAVFFVIFGFGSAIWSFYTKKTNVANLISFSVGSGLPFVIMVAIIVMSGNFSTFWFWTYTYLSEYGSKVSSTKGLEYLKNEMSAQFSQFPFLLILSLAGLLFLLFSKISRDLKILIIGFVAASILTVVPGFYFRSHYFITLIPALSLMVACLYHVSIIFKEKSKWMTYIFFILIAGSIAQLLFNQRDYLFVESPKDISRKIYGINPFIESIPLARYIKKNTSENDKIAVLGSEPQIYYYTNRLSATGYIYTYNLMEPHPYALKMQEEMIAEIEKNKPKMIVYVTVPTSWMLKDNSQKKILTWLQNYLYMNYVQTGIIEYKPSGEVKMAWDDQVTGYGPVGNQSLIVYNRKI